jgi:hypothetical protein
MKKIALAALLLTFAAVPRALEESGYRYGDSVEHPFRSGGRVRLTLSAGDHQVVPGDSGRIRVAWRTRSADDLDRTRVRVRVNGADASISASGPRRGSYRVRIELPQRSDLLLRMSAGDLSIGGLVGNKDVHLRAGDLNIEVPDPQQYRRVRASVVAGDLAATPFRFSTGGLFRSFAHEGKGRFELRVRLWAGDLRLVPASTARLE